MSKKIIICDECDGEGIIRCKELTDYHNGHYDRWTEECGRCKNSGRLLETINVTKEFYIPSKAKARGKK